MSTGLPKRFDPERLAAQGVRLAGTIDTASMPRLAAMLAVDEAVPVDVELRAHRDDARRLLLTGNARADLPLVCQRCMEPVLRRVDARVALAVVPDEDAARNLPAELDPLLLERESDVDLPALMEDELILALPPVAMHDSVEDCGERAHYDAGADEAFDSGEKRENPFAVLKKLKNGNTDRGN